MLPRSSYHIITRALPASLLVMSVSCSGADAHESDTHPETAGPDSEPDPVDAAPDGGEPGCPGQIREVANEGSLHVAEGSPLSFTSNPPASGNHYPIWTRFEAFDPEVVPRGYWVHNLEHGGVALLYRPDTDEGTIEQLQAVYGTLPNDPACDHPRALITADPELDDAIAVVAWNWVLEATCVDQAQILDFLEQHRGQAPEDICGDGSYVP